MSKEQRLKEENKALHIGVVIERLFLILKKWRLKAKYFQLDMDMQCTNMAYEEYQKEIGRLNNESDFLNGL